MTTTGVVRPTEVWMRNPTFYIRECAEVAHRDLVFMQAHLTKYRTDPIKWVTAHYGNIPWRVLVVHNGQQNASAFEYDSAHGSDVIAEWPIWQYGESLSQLKKLAGWADTNAGRVIITGVPNLSASVPRGFMTETGRLQEKYPFAILHVHGLYSYQFAFGTGVGAADVDPKANTSKGALWLANGKICLKWEDAEPYRYWIEQTGYRYEDMKDPRIRTMSSIRAAEWAGVNFRRNILFSVGGASMERDDEGNPFVRERGKVHFGWKDKPKAGDYIACDNCELQANCKFYRPRSLCAVPGSPGEEIADKLRTRDVDTALEVMSELAAINAERLARALEVEAANPDVINQDVTKLLESTFKQTETVAKMHDPGRFGTNSGRSNEPALPTGAAPAVLMSAIVERLKKEGIPPAAITPDMVELVMKTDPSDQDRMVATLVKNFQPAVGP